MHKLEHAMKHSTCPLCSHEESLPVYDRVLDTGSSLGRVRTIFVICQRCGFMYMNPRPTEMEMRRHYASSSSSGNVYHDNSADSAHSRKNQQRRNFFLPFFPCKQAGSLAEVGCARGDFLASLELKDWKRIGIEPSAEAALLAARHPGLSVICCALEEAEIEAESQDVVCCFSVLEHVYDVLAFGALLRRLLKPAGVLCLEVPDTMRPVPQISEFFCFEHLSHFTEVTLGFWLRCCGFGEVRFDHSAGSRLRVVATKTDEGGAEWRRSPAILGVLSQSRLRLTQAVESYRREKLSMEADLQRRLDSAIVRWRSKGVGVAVYGAGMHTEHLLALVDLDMVIDIVIDGDPRKAGRRFCRWVIQEDAALRSNSSIGAVVISSRSFQREIEARVRELVRGRDVDIFLCYPHDS